MSILNRIRTICVALYLALALILVLPWIILWSIIANDPDFLYWTCVGGIRIANRMAGIRTKTEGLENIPPGPCIFISNHASNIDPPVIIPAVPRRIAIPTKKEVFRLPFLGYAMRRVKFVCVDRENREAAAASLNLAVQYLKEGLSFVAFAEGTRSPDGRLKSFKKGPLLVAIQAGVLVVPVSLIGTQKLMRKGEWTVRSGEVIVRFGAPVDASKFTIAQRGELRAQIEARVASMLPLEQQPLPAAAGRCSD
jgi:1-acyl-sn-glycerol-3-phosphate acyltransferase